MDLMNLVAKLTLDSSQYTSGIEAARKLATDFSKGLSTIATTIGKAENALNTAGSSADTFSDKTDNAAESVEELRQAESQTVAVTNKVGETQETAAKKMNIFGTAAESVKSRLDNLGKVGELIKTGFNNVKTAVGNLKNKFSESSISFDTVKQKFNEITQSGKNLVNSGLNKIQSGVDLLKSKFESAKNSLKLFNNQQNSNIQSTSNYTNALQENAKEAEKNSKESETLKNRIKVLSGIYDEAKKNVEKLTDEFNKSVKETGEASNETRELAKQLDKAEREYRDAEKNLKKYSDTMDDTSKSVKYYNNAIDDTSKSVKKLGDEESKATKKTSTFIDTLKGMVSAQVILGFLNKAKDAIIGFAKSSIQAGMNFDSSMSQVAATMGTTVDKIQNLRDFAQEMGRTTAFSATQAADALNYMALAGYDAETSMAMLPNVLNLAAAGSMDLAAASDMVTDSQSALGLTLTQTSQLVDMMAKASSKSNTSVSQLGEAILTVGGTAKGLSGGMTELNTVLGILADNSIKGAEGGTHLRNIILAMNPTTSAAVEAFDKLGVKTYDSTGHLRGLNDIFLELSDAMSGLTEKEKDTLKSAIFNKTDLAAVNALLATSADRWRDLSREIDKGISLGASVTTEGIAEMQQAFSKMYDKMGNDIETFSKEAKSYLENNFDLNDEAANAAIQAFIKSMKSGVTSAEELQKALSESGSAAKAMAETQLDNLAGDITLFQSALEGAQIAISDKLSPTLRKFVQLGSDGLSKITKLFKEGDLSASNLGESIAKGINNVNWSNLATNFSQKLSDLINGIFNFTISFIQNIDWGKLGVQLVKSIVNVVTNIDWTNIVSKAFELLGAVIAGAVQLRSGISAAIKNLIANIISDVKAYFDAQIKAAGGNIIKGLFNGILDASRGINQWIIDHIFKPFINGFKNAFGIHSPSTVMQTMGGYIVDGLLNGIKNLPSKVISVFTDLKSKIVSWGNGIKTSVKTIGTNLITGMWNGINDKVGWITSKIQGFGDSVIKKIKGIFGIKSPSRVMREIGNYIDEGLAIGIDEEADKPINAISTLGNNMLQDFEFDGLLNMPDLMSGISGQLSVENSSNAQSQTDLLLNKIIDVLYEIDRTMYDKIASAIDGMGIDWNERELGRFVKEYA